MVGMATQTPRWRFGFEPKPEQEVVGSLVPAALHSHGALLHSHGALAYTAGKSYTMSELFELNGLAPQKEGFFEKLKNILP